MARSLVTQPNQSAPLMLDKTEGADKQPAFIQNLLRSGSQMNPKGDNVARTQDIAFLGSTLKSDQISFLVRRFVSPAGATHSHTGDLSPFVWDGASRNMGNSFSLTDNLFTAPKSGWYHFSFQIGARRSGGAPVDLFKITLTQTPAGNSLVARLDNTGGLENVCLFSAMTYVPAGENVFVAVDVSGSGTWADCLDVAGWFTGTLVN